MNKVLICRAVHDNIHAQKLLPRKAPREEIQKLMEGFKKSEKATHASTRISNGALDGSATAPASAYKPTGQRDPDISRGISSDERTQE